MPSIVCVRRNQLRFARRVDAVEARRDRRRAADSHVHFLGSRGAYHPYDLPAGRAANDRVVDENHPLAVEDAADRVQLDLHAEVPDRLLRLDEGAPDVVITNQSHPQRHARGLGEAHRRAHARVRHRHDNVGVDRLFAREHAPELGADLVDASAEHVAVRTREIHVLEDAVGQRRRRKRLDRPDPVGGNDQDLARQDVALVGRANQVHRAGLGADHVGFAKPAERQRPEAVRIADRDQTCPCVSITSEKAPCTCATDSTMASSTLRAFDRA